jgi:hypothetical protein
LLNRVPIGPRSEHLYVTAPRESSADVLAGGIAQATRLRCQTLSPG